MKITIAVLVVIIIVQGILISNDRESIRILTETRDILEHNARREAETRLAHERDRENNVRNRDREAYERCIKQLDEALVNRPDPATWHAARRGCLVNLGVDVENLERESGR